MGAQGGGLKANEVELTLPFSDGTATHRGVMDFRALQAIEDAIGPLAKLFPQRPGEPMPEVPVSTWVLIAYEMLKSGSPQAGFSQEDVGNAWIGAGHTETWTELAQPCLAVFAGSQREDDEGKAESAQAVGRYPIRTAYGTAVALWGVDPSAFWRLTPCEWWAIADAHIEANTVQDTPQGTLTAEEVVVARANLAAANRRQARKRGQEAYRGARS